MAPEWYDERNNLVELLWWLDERGELTLSDAIYAVEKPWKFTADYDRMRKAQADLVDRAEAAV